MEWNGMNDRIEQTNRTLKTWASIEIADKRERESVARIRVHSVYNAKNNSRLCFTFGYMSHFLCICMCVWLSLVNTDKRHQPPATIARDWMARKGIQKEMAWLKVREWEIVVVKWKCLNTHTRTALTIRKTFHLRCYSFGRKRQSGSHRNNNTNNNTARAINEWGREKTQQKWVK